MFARKWYKRWINDHNWQPMREHVNIDGSFILYSGSFKVECHANAKYENPLKIS